MYYILLESSKSYYFADRCHASGSSSLRSSDDSDYRPRRMIVTSRGYPAGSLRVQAVLEAKKPIIVMKYLVFYEDGGGAIS